MLMFSAYPQKLGIVYSFLAKEKHYSVYIYHWMRKKHLTVGCLQREEASCFEYQNTVTTLE